MVWGTFDPAGLPRLDVTLLRPSGTGPRQRLGRVPNTEVDVVGSDDGAVLVAANTGRPAAYLAPHGRHFGPVVLPGHARLHGGRRLATTVTSRLGTNVTFADRLGRFGRPTTLAEGAGLILLQPMRGGLIAVGASATTQPCDATDCPLESGEIRVAGRRVSDPTRIAADPEAALIADRPVVLWRENEGLERLVVRPPGGPPRAVRGGVGDDGPVIGSAGRTGLAAWGRPDGRIGVLALGGTRQTRADSARPAEGPGGRTKNARSQARRTAGTSRRRLP